MTVTTDAQITLAAWLVEQGDYVLNPSTEEWEHVEGVRHTQHQGEWRVTLELSQYAGAPPDAPRPRLVLAPDKELQVWRA